MRRPVRRKEACARGGDPNGSEAVGVPRIVPGRVGVAQVVPIAVVAVAALPALRHRGRRGAEQNREGHRGNGLDQHGFISIV